MAASKPHLSVTLRRFLAVLPLLPLDRCLAVISFCPLSSRPRSIIQPSAMRAWRGVSVLLIAVAAAVLCCWSALCFAQPPLLPLPAAQFHSPSSVSAQSVAASPPVQLSAADRAALLDSAQRSGYSWSEALSIVQTAYNQHIPLPSTDSGQQSTVIAAAAVTALLSSSAACPPMDGSCSFARSCARCYYDHSTPRCLPCLALLECNNLPQCQVRQACRVCSSIDTAEADRPHACVQLAPHC